MMVIAVIGAGASGMAAAIAAAKKEENEVIVFERQARVGRKLAATGNGRCNLTNLNASMEGYHGNDARFCGSALLRFSVEDTLSWFRDMGLYTVAEASGRVYPYSDQANSVVDVLRFALEKPNIRLLLGNEVKSVKKSGEGFRIDGGEEIILADRLIVACGGLAGSKLGGTMSGYKLLRAFGHACTKLRPTLVQLKSTWSGCAALKGVRANCRVGIYHDGVLHAESAGELQFTEYGVSGPVIFEVSRDTCNGSGEWICRLDLLPEIAEDALRAELCKRRATNWNADDLLTGILHNRLGRVIVQQAGMKGLWKIADLRDEELDEVCRHVKHLEITLTEPMGMDSAQVTAGGIVTDGFDPETMQSRLVAGLYACGEVLDIDGDCGGYNLQWAWSSGRLAGSHAGGIT